MFRNNLIVTISMSQESNVPEQISSQPFRYHRNQMSRNKSHRNHFDVTGIKCSGTNLITIVSMSKQELNIPEQISSQPFRCHRNRMFRNKSHHNKFNVKTGIEYPGTNLIATISMSQESNVPEQISSQ